jgi:putative FmdB family regulatory protein
MPIYEYRCERGHTFEVMQRMTDDPLELCEEHGTPVQRVFHPVAVHFKGSGFYNTDYGKKKSGAASEGASSDSSKNSDSASGSSDSGSSSSSKDSGRSRPPSPPALRTSLGSKRQR